MPCRYDHQGGQVSTPAQDFNAPSAQVPADHKQQTPEFLQKLISQLKELENKQSEVFAKMYRPESPLGGRPKKSYKPAYEEKLELQRQDKELDEKIAALKGQIRELHVLIARGEEPKPELEKAPPPSA